MNREIKTLLVVFVVLMLAVVGNLSWVQIFGSDEISGNAYNKRRLVEEYAVERGEMISADHKVLARSVDTGREYRYQRVYPAGSLFANVTGYDSWRYGRTGLEKAYNDELMGEGRHLTLSNLANRLLGESRKGNSLVLTVDSRVQETAADALGDRKGAVVALDPKTGAVLAMVTSPTYDPNTLVPTRGGDPQEAMNSLGSDPGSPLLDRTINGLYPPGSAFKVVVSAAALDSGTVMPDDRFECDGSLLVNGYTVYDFAKKSHGELSFTDALVLSCNIAFAQIGLKLGADKLVEYSERFGFNQEIPFDLPVTPSSIQSADSMDEVALAASSFGQAQDLATPMQMALVASAVANAGTVMEPYLVDEVQTYKGNITENFGAKRWHRVMSGESADTLNRMMVQVVSRGTGTAASIDGVDVAGKTGTAEVGEGKEPDAWFICFAPAQDPVVAVAVVIENGGEGGRTAAPVAREVVEKVLELNRLLLRERRN